MAKSWQEAYRDFDNMTIPELKDLLKSKDLPVSGEKLDLIRYLIFEEYPDIYQNVPHFQSDRQTSRSHKASLWLKFKYELWGRSFDAINYQDIYS